MSTLVVSFYGEGSSDYAFLTPIIQRTLQDILPHVDVLLIELDHHYLKVTGLNQIDKMKRVAEHGGGIIVFHLDADAPTTHRAYEERFQPGYQRILQHPGGLNISILPVIPVRNTNAWMLVDFGAFQRVVGTHLRPEELGFVSQPHQVESIQDPKTVFRTAVREARPRRKPIPFDDVFRPLAQQVDLDLLKKVPAFQEFLERLNEMLTHFPYLWV